MKDLIDLAVKTRPLKLNEKLRTAYNLGNVSLVKLRNGNYIVSVRQFNYNFLGSFGRLKYKHYKDYLSGRANYFVELDSDFNFVRQLDTDIDTNILRLLEDIRIVAIGPAKLQLSATMIGVKALPGVCIMQAKLNYAEGKLENCPGTFRYISSTTTEKNWIPMEDYAGAFISRIGDGQLELAIGNQMKIVQCEGAKKLRGSSQLMPYKDRYVAVCHTVQAYELDQPFQSYCEKTKYERYQFHVASFSRDLSNCKVGQPFTFLGADVTFLCSIVVDGDIVHLPITVTDQDTYIVDVPASSLLLT